MEIIAWLGFSHGLFAAVLMMAKRERTVSDQILTAWLCLLAIEFLSCAIDINVFGEPLLSSSFLLFNPAFYLYVKSLTDETFKLKYIQLLHLVPFVAFKTASYILQEPFSLISFFDPDSTILFRYLFSVASVISWISYNSISAINVVQHRRKLKNEFSTLRYDIKLTWLLFVVVFYNLFCGGAIIIGVISVIFGFSLPLTYIYVYSGMLVLVYILGFYGLMQKRVVIKDDLDNDSEKKYQKSILTKDKKQKIKNIILEYFKTHKPYLNPEFNMTLLSESLKIPKYQLTEVLNVELNKNFFQFVNEYRVKEVKRHLSNKKNYYSIEAIGYESGFSSKSSFFQVFKKITGKTPLEYKNTL
ncbi:MAG: helix-turn-helix domain-containing protein [Bacteroidota bacterium]